MRRISETIGLYLMAALCLLLIVPPLDAPDARGHLEYAAHLASGGGLVPLDEAAEISYEMVQQPPLYYAIVALLDRAETTAAALLAAPENPYIVDCVGVKSTVLTPDTPRKAQVGFLIPRLISLLGGILAVGGCGLWLAGTLSRKNVAWLASMLLALTPMFVFESVAITNDILTVGLATGAVLIGSEAYRRDRWWLWLLAGAVEGLASLTKYSGLLAAVPLGVIWIWHVAQKRSWRAASRALWLGAGFLLLAGWWFARNVVLYGELVPMDTLLPLLPGLARAQPLTAAGLGNLLRSAWRSFVGVYACGISAPEWLVWGWAGLIVAGLVGLLMGIVRGLGKTRWLVVSASAAWLLASFISMALWMGQLRYSGQGRLLFIAAPALYALVAIGWDCLLDTSRRAWRSAVVGWLLLSVLVTGIQCYRVYGPPQTLKEVTPTRPVDAALVSGIRVVGLNLEDGATLTTPGEIPVTIYLTTDQAMDEFHTLYVQVVLPDDSRLYSWEGVACEGRLTTPEWRVGEVVPLDLTLRIDHPVDALANLIVGAYPYGQPDDGEGIQVARIRLLDPNSPIALWDGGLALLDATPLLTPEGAAFGATLHWMAQENVSTDYTVSLQALDAHGALVAQCDQQPQQGEYPTSTWSAGRHILDEHIFETPASDWSTLIVLLYDQQGQRLAVGVDEFFVMATR